MLRSMRSMDKKACFVFLLAGLALMPLGTQAQSNPSFDCQSATTPVEKLICSDPKLGELDRQMVEKAPTTFLKEQRRWLEDRAIGCGLDPRQPGFHTLALPSPAQ